MTAEEARLAATAALADPTVSSLHLSRAAELVTLALAVGITRDESAALVAARLSQWDDEVGLDDER